MPKWSMVGAWIMNPPTAFVLLPGGFCTRTSMAVSLLEKVLSETSVSAVTCVSRDQSSYLAVDRHE